MEKMHVGSEVEVYPLVFTCMFPFLGWIFIDRIFFSFSTYCEIQRVE